MRQSWIFFLLATAVPTAFELAIIILSSRIPNLLVIGGNGQSVPSPSVLGIVWGALFVYVIGAVPFLLLYSLVDFGRKTALSFAVVDVVLYITFFRLIAAPAKFSSCCMVEYSCGNVDYSSHPNKILFS